MGQPRLSRYWRDSIEVAGVARMLQAVTPTNLEGLHQPHPQSLLS